MVSTRYRLDPYKNGVVDQKTNMLVCEKSDATQYFSKKKSAIRNRINLIDQEIRKLEEQKDDIRKKCRHTNAVAEYGSDTGNWCKSDDSYWINYHCYDCGDRWVKDQ